jgi:hypothetical protein
MAKTPADRKTSASLAHDTARSLCRCLSTLGTKRFNAGDVENLIKLLEAPAIWERVASWDDAVRIYLALDALGKAMMELQPPGKQQNGRLETRLKTMRPKLDFPKGFDSPLGFDPGRLRP